MTIKSIRLSVLIGLKYLKRYKAFFIGGAFLLIILIITLLKLSTSYKQQTVTIGLIGTYQEHDLPSEVTKLISSSLVEASDDGRIKPKLATGWEVNNDATQFKFKLKDSLKWSDNTPVFSKDIELNIPNTQISYPDDKTIQINLKEPYSPLPSVLTKDIFKKGALIGTGPYKIQKIEKSRIFIKKISLVPLDPKMPYIYIRFYPSEKVALTGFNLGEIQALLGFNNIKDIAGSPLVAVKQKVDYSKIVTVLFNTQDFLLRNRSLRQALSFQIPQIEGEDTANNPYPKNFWAYDEKSKKYLSNPKEAKEAIGRAKSQIPDEKINGELLLTTTPNLEEIGQTVVKAWKELGFESKLRVESGIPQNFQALLITQRIPLDPDQYSLWHATQTKTNLTKYDSDRVDLDLEEGRKIYTEEERKEKYFDFQKALLEDAPAIFLYFPKYNMIYLKKSEAVIDGVLDI